MNEKKILAAVYTLKIEGIKSRPAEIAHRIGESPEDIQGYLGRLLRRSMLEKKGGELALTAEGRSKLKVVMIGGAFEIIHPGHVHTIKEAKKLGDVLVVVVAADKTVLKNKRRAAITQENLRAETVSSIRYVDAAILGGEGSIYDTLARVGPDVVALGYDQNHREDEIKNEAERRGLHLTVTRLSSPMPSVKTSKIVGEFA